MSRSRQKPRKHSSSCLYPRCHVAESADIGPWVVLGAPPCPDDDAGEFGDLDTYIGARCYISPYVILYCGARLEEDVIVDAFCRIGHKSSVGHGTRVVYGARIHNNVHIGSNCVIGGNCSDGVWIGNSVTHMGRIAHTYNAPHQSWRDTEEPSPRIEDRAVVGANSLIVGPVTIGQNSYVAAGEIVRRSVPPNCVQYGGRIFSANEWKGTLSRTGFFQK